MFYTARKPVSLLESKQIYMVKYDTLQISNGNSHLWTTQKVEYKILEEYKLDTSQK